MNGIRAMKVMLSAVQPSNGLTIGNYLGAIKNWVDLHTQYNCYFFAVDLHAITVRQDPVKLRQQTYEALATYLAAGIDPDRANVFVQSHVPEHAELGWILTCFSSMGELGRMTQFKDKSAKLGDNEGIGAGLFMYPVLMAADILLYQTDLVPVGDDQRQHLQLARDVAQRFNNVMGVDVFRIPEPIVPKIGARIMSLQNPLAKMSKSDVDPHATIFLLDSDDDIVKKIKRAVTDSGAEVTYEESKPGVRNLLDIQAAITGRPITDIVASYEGKKYGHLKVETADIVVNALRPIRERTRELLDDKAGLERILAKGAENARRQASVTLRAVQEATGLIPRLTR